MTLAQTRRLEINIHHLRSVEQNLDALFIECESAELRRAQELVLRALEALREVELERKVA